MADCHGSLGPFFSFFFWRREKRGVSHLPSLHHQGLHLCCWLPFLFYASPASHLPSTKARAKPFPKGLWVFGAFSSYFSSYLVLSEAFPQQTILRVLLSASQAHALQCTINPTCFPEDCYNPCLFHMHSSRHRAVIPAAGMCSPWEVPRFTWLHLTTCGFSLAFNNSFTQHTSPCIHIPLNKHPLATRSPV